MSDVDSFDVPWRAVLDAAPGALAVLDRSNRLVAANRGLLLSFGCDELPEFFAEVLHPDDRREFSRYVERVADNELPSAAAVVRCISGEEVQALQARLTPVPAGANVLVCAVFQPVVESAAVAEGRLHRFLRHSFSTFSVVDEFGVVIESSGRFQTLLGYEHGYWESRSLFEVLVPDEYPKALEFRERLLAKPGERMSVELRVVRANGEEQLLFVEAVNLLAHPDVRGVILLTRNITEERRTALELAERRAQAEAVANARARLLATVSHELRNPLHALLGTAEMLAAEPLPPRAASLARSFAAQLKSLSSVTRDLLETASADAGAVELRVEATSLRRLVADVVDFGRLMADGRPVTVLEEFDARSPDTVFADGPRLQQVLRNLVGNAVKFTERGSVTVRVRPLSGSLVEFAVADTGVGFPPEEVGLVLEPFRSASTAGAARGAGLGLALAQRLTSAMNGQLHVDSEVGRGSTFTVTLPLEPAVLPAAATECADVDDLSILVVDDDEVNRELGRRQLDVLGLRSVVAASGERAIELLHDGYRPTLVLMDQQMPGMTGLETLAAMRRMGADTAAIPVVMVTGSVTEADQSAFAEANVAGVVAKPASVDDIRQAMSEPLRQLRLRRFIDPMVLERLAADFQGAGSDVVVSIVESFLDELPQRCEQLVEAIAAGDVVGCRRSAHTLKSSSRLVGAVRLADACAQLEAELCSTVDVTAIMHCTAEALSTWRERR